MTVEARLKEALATIGDPVENGVYTGKADRYLVFNTATVPTDYADDEPQHERYLIQVHLFAPLGYNYTAMRRKIKRVLSEAGFRWPDCTDASDEEGRHIVFETEYVEGMEM